MNQTEQHDLMKEGWTRKVRFIDKDPAKGLLGIRLTNAAKIWAEAYSIQIFDRTTVTLAQKANATIDDHVSLTKDDGRDFLEWLRVAHPEILPPDVWAKFPEGESESAPPIPSSDEARAHLLRYMVPRYPELFGPGGMGTTAPLEATILAALKSGENMPAIEAENNRVAMRVILTLETNAHACYKQANAHLRTAREATTNEQRLIHGRAAVSLIGAADEYQRAAQEMRQEKSYDLPGASFPEAIDAAQAWDVVKAATVEGIAEFTEAHSRISGPQFIADESGASSGAGIEQGYQRGEMVVVTDSLHPQFRQMAEIDRRVSRGENGQPDRYALTFKGDDSRRPILTAAQFKRPAARF